MKEDQQAWEAQMIKEVDNAFAVWTRDFKHGADNRLKEKFRNIVLVAALQRSVGEVTEGEKEARIIFKEGEDDELMLIYPTEEGTRYLVFDKETEDISSLLIGKKPGSYTSVHRSKSSLEEVLKDFVSSTTPQGVPSQTEGERKQVFGLAEGDNVTTIPPAQPTDKDLQAEAEQLYPDDPDHTEYGVAWKKGGREGYIKGRKHSSTQGEQKWISVALEPEDETYAWVLRRRFMFSQVDLARYTKKSGWIGFGGSSYMDDANGLFLTHYIPIALPSPPLSKDSKTDV